MIDEILKATGLPFQETQFLRPPAGTYVVYMDDLTTDGPDKMNRIYLHNITLEVYEPKPDKKAETAIESELDKYGLHFIKQARYWIQTVQRYQVIYEFDYYTKK